MKVLQAQTEKNGQATLVDVVVQLKQAQDAYYSVTTTSKIAKLEEGSITADEAQDIDEIYVINKKCGYEVKVDRMLKASIMRETQKGEEANKTYTITFDANGGHIEKTSKQIKYNEEYGELETPTKIKYNFDGWYTQEEGGTKIISNMKYTQEENQTLYAHWTEKTYVSDGLVLRYDGIDNTGNGHSSTATTWKDLSGNGNDGILNGGMWENNCLKFDGVDDFVNCGRQDYSNVTIEVVASCGTIDSDKAVISNTEGGGYSIYLNDKGKFIYYGYKEKEGYITTQSTNEAIVDKLYALSGRINLQTISLNVNDDKYTKSFDGNLGMTVGECILAIGCEPGGSVSHYGYFFNGRIYSVRIYNRSLTDEEVRNNYEIDKLKYGIDK